MKHFELYKKSNSASRIRDLHFKDADQFSSQFCLMGSECFKGNIKCKDITLIRGLRLQLSSRYQIVVVSLTVLSPSIYQTVEKIQGKKS